MLVEKGQDSQMVQYHHKDPKLSGDPHLKVVEKLHDAPSVATNTRRNEVKRGHRPTS